MNIQYLSSVSLAVTLTALCPILRLSSAQAQVVPDTSLGDESSIVTPDVEVRGDLADLIEGGAARGSNLFQSFSDFNVLAGERVYFANPVGIDAILSRVTGANPSNLFGTLGVDGPADLFFVNPNGIVFGETVQLDVEGAFHATTADGIPLGEQVFSATVPESSQLLSVSPSTNFLGRISQDSGSVVSRGQVQAGEALSLTANNLDLRGQVAAGGNVSLLAADRLQIRDTPEVPFIALAGGDLLVQGNQQVDIMALRHPESGLFSYGDMVLRSAQPVSGDAHYQTGQSFQIEALDRQPGSLVSPHDPVIRSLGDVSFNSYFGTSLHILAGGSVSIPGAIVITGPEIGELGTDFLVEEITLSDGETAVEIDGRARATLDIRAGMNPESIGVPSITGADFLIDAFDLDLLTRPTLSPPVSDMRADLDVGSIIFTSFSSILELQSIFSSIDSEDPNALQQVLFDRLSVGDVLLTNSYRGNTALEGDITVSSTLESFLSSLGITDLAVVPNLAIRSGSADGGGRIYVDSRGTINLNDLISVSAIDGASLPSAAAGDIVLIAQGDITLNPGTALTSFGASSGDLRFVSGRTLNVDDSVIAGITTMEGEKGNNLTIDAADVVITNQSGAGVETASSISNLLGTESAVLRALIDLVDGRSGLLLTALEGESGDISVKTTGLQINNNASSDLGGGAGIATFGPARVGNIVVDADLITISDNTSSTNPPDFNRERGLALRDIPTGIATAALGDKQGGNLTLNVRQLILRNGAGITAGSVLSGSRGGDGGQLQINGAQTIDLSSGSVLIVGTLGPGSSGRLEIHDAGTVTLDEGAAITADTIGAGNAGDIVMNGDRLIVRGGARIGAATGDRGTGGNIELVFSEQIKLEGAFDESLEEPVRSGLFTNAQGIGDAGNLTVKTPDLTLSDGATITASTSGPGQGGSINILGSPEAFEMSSLSLTDSTITASTVGRANAGNINIDINGPIVLDNSQISAFVELDDRLSGFERGNFSGWAAFGDIRIEGSDLGIAPVEGTRQALLTNTFSGNAFPVSGSDLAELLNLSSETNAESLNSPNRFIEGSAIKTEFEAQAGDRIGFVWNFLTAEAAVEEDVNDFAFVTLFSAEELADTGFPDGSGSGFTDVMVDLADDDTPIAAVETGFQTFNATIPAAGTYELGIGVVNVGDRDLRSGILVDQVQLPAGTGLGGNIDIQAQSVDLIQSELTARSNGLGNAGNLTLEVDEKLSALNSDISTEAQQASGGLIEITAGDILLEEDSDIRTNVFSGQGGGGDITLRADSIVAFDDSDILASADDGRGGDITLDTPAFFGENYIPGAPPPFEDNNRVDVNASGDLASGAISLPDVTFIENSLADLPEVPLDPETLLASSCIARVSPQEGSFTVTGSGGLPRQSGDAVVSPFPTGTVRTSFARPAPSMSSLSPQPGQPLEEADGVYQLPDGRLVMSRECSAEEQ